MTEQGDRVRVMSRTGSAWRFVGDLKKVRELEARHQTRRFDFCELTEARRICTLWVPHEIGARWINQHSKIVSLLLMLKPLTQVNKKVLYLKKKFEFRDSYVLYVFYIMYICNERPMNILQIVKQLHSLYVHIYSFCVVVSSEIFLHMIQSNINNFQTDLFDP